MKVVVLDAMEDENNLTMSLQDTLKDRDDVVWFKLRDYEIKPCRSCGNCAYKTCGKCIIKDDFEEVILEIVKSKIMVFLTPIHFGGYSSQLKKIIDRLMVLGAPLYMVKKGRFLHPMRYDIKWIFGLGLTDGICVEQEKSFEKLVENNALNMSLKYKALPFRRIDKQSQIKTLLEPIFQEALI